MKRISNRIVDRIIDLSLVAILASMSILVAVNVFFRFVLDASIFWGDEVAMILMVWLTFLGAAVATRDKSHYVFSYLVNRLRGRPLFLFVMARDFINLSVICLLGFYSGQVAIEIQTWIMPATEISRAWVYAASPVGCLFMLYYGMLQMLDDIGLYGENL